MWFAGYYVGHTETSSYYVAMEQHDLCYDTKTHEAWVARKGTQLRCFLERKDYPHTVKGSYLDDNS